MSQQFKILKSGESSAKSTVATPEGLVTCRHATVHKSLGDGERFDLTWVVDLRDLSAEETAAAAAEYFIIKIRRVFAKIDKPKSAEWDNAEFDAKDFVTVRQSKTEKLAKTLATFSDEELAALGLTRASEKA